MYEWLIVEVYAKEYAYALPVRCIGQLYKRALENSALCETKTHFRRGVCLVIYTIFVSQRNHSQQASRNLITKNCQSFVLCYFYKVCMKCL